MRYRKLDANGDYSFGNGLDDFWINVPEAVAQAAYTWLKLFQGEWFLDITQGTPWFQGVLGVYNQANADSLLKDQIVNNVTGVQDISEFQSTSDQTIRKYSIVTCELNTIFGPTSVQIANYRNF